MKHEHKCRALIRSIVRDARADKSTLVFVDSEGDCLNESQRERDILDSVFSVDESQIILIDLHTQRTLGTLSVVLDYDTAPCEVIQDFSANAYTETLVRKAESKI
tara:strand:- start:1438 stop:1752 length:315 start_codon:yes stop_codon:yes gene_type:complete